jgi:hypothetical protein
MSIIVDKKFIGLVSPILDKFKWKKSDLANFRCPICGDSKKSKVKARAYFFSKKNSMFFYCQNCGASHSFYRFLEIVSPSLCKEYSLERWKENGEYKIDSPAPNIKFEQPIFHKDMKNAQRLDTLEENHMCVTYVRERKIPISSYSRLYYVDNYGSWLQSIDPTITNIPNDKRLVIPIFNANGLLIGVQGRTLENSHLRYITKKFDDEIERLWFGLDQKIESETVYVVEGPIDSLFIPNCVAMLGINSGNIPKPLRGKRIIFVVDNEPRNKDVIRRMYDLIDAKREIVIWPETIVEKDINDMVLSGMSPIEIVKIIQDNACSGLEAKLKLNEWKKI